LQGFAVPKESQGKVAEFSFHGTPAKIKHGDVVIAAITSCTNTSNPNVMLGAALVAKKACELGLEVRFLSLPTYFFTCFAKLTLLNHGTLLQNQMELCSYFYTFLLATVPDIIGEYIPCCIWSLQLYVVKIVFQLFFLCQSGKAVD
jgi:hypothetical protein